MKVLIGMPTLGEIPVKTVASLLSLDKPQGSEIGFVNNSLVYDARNELCQRAVKGGFDYLFFLDSDMIFPADTLTKLMALNTDIATAVCYARQGKHEPCVYSKLVKRNLFHESSSECFTDVSQGIFDIAGCGMAVCLIKIDVVKKLVKKYKGTPFEPFGNMGEDLAFCYRARKLGYKIKADGTIPIGHIGEAVITKKDYERNQLVCGKSGV